MKIFFIHTLCSFLLITSAKSTNESNDYRIFSPKVIVITGTAQGIGLTAATYLAQQGYCIAAGVRTLPATPELQQLVLQFPERVIIVHQDVTQQATIDASCTAILERFGRIDVLINNACHAFLGPVETQTIEEQQSVMDVNYFGPVRMIQAIAPIMRKQESGSIINISSVAGIDAAPHIESYTASKYALEGLSESLAFTLAPWNISVSLIEFAGARTKVAQRIKPGSRVTKQTECYSAYNKILTDFMHKQLDNKPETPGIIEPIEVAHCIEQIIISEKPHMRYQVGEVAQKIAAVRFKDVTGDSHVQEKKEQFAQLGFIIRNANT